MVDFAGYALPVQYKDGVIKSHMHTRTDGCASLFDVSHMGQIRFVPTRPSARAQPGARLRVHGGVAAGLARIGTSSWSW